MKSKVMFLIVLTLCFVYSNYAEGINGKWKGKVTTPNGDLELSYNFIVKGDSLSGKVTSSMGELDLLNGKVKGDEFSFKIDMGGNVLSSEGKLIGDKIVLKTIEFPSEMELVRNDKTDINGKWLGKVAGPDGDMEMVFTFNVQGDNLTGTNKSQMGELPLLKGKINGDQFTFDVEVMGNMMTHNCKIVDDDTINVKADAMGNPVEMNLKRMKE
jgi:hypothetical protein